MPPDNSLESRLRERSGPVERVGRWLADRCVSAGWVTGFGLMVALGAAGAMAFGEFVFALLLVVASAAADVLDGAVARAAGRAGQGALWDSLADRIADGVWYAALAWWAAQNGTQAALGGFLICLLAAGWTSYLRSRADAEGRAVSRGGGRLERVVLLVGGLAVLAVSPTSSVVVACVLAGHALGGFLWRLWGVARVQNPL